MPDDNVFINCPFDPHYRPIFEALVFAVFDAGFVPRCSLEVADGTQNRLQKILRIIEECKYGIHDISRTELDPLNGLPRFNMPFELGIFFGCKHFGKKAQNSKCCLILDIDRYRYQKFISDISGNDIESHEGRLDQAIKRTRDWLRTNSGRSDVPSAPIIIGRHGTFRQQLPDMCKHLGTEPAELVYQDYSHLVSEWLRFNSLPVVSVVATTKY